MRNFSFVVLLITLFLSCSTVASINKSRKKADRLAREGKYAEAIEAYQEHINYRLSLKNRPDWENPHIYFLDIGDLYLQQGDLPNAIAYYEKAEKKNVKSSYINDRFRHVATWLENQERSYEALEHLKKYRKRDPPMFDMMLDRIAKKIVKQEEEAEKKQEAREDRQEEQL
jgi:tetratricopeptide (TPR) repeat protein